MINLTQKQDTQFINADFDGGSVSTSLFAKVKKEVLNEKTGKMETAMALNEKKGQMEPVMINGVVIQSNNILSIYFLS